MDLLNDCGLHVGTFLFCAMSGLVPLMNSELFLLYLGATARPAELPGLLLVAALGQMSSKSLLYLGGRGALKLPGRRSRARIDAVRARLSGSRRTAGRITFVSALTGLPLLLRDECRRRSSRLALRTLRPPRDRRTPPALLGPALPSRPPEGSDRMSLQIALAIGLLVSGSSIEPPDVTGETRCIGVAAGECLQVTVTGLGQDVVLVPGLFGSAFSFRHVIRRLTAAGYRSIVIEPLGVGHSARPRNGDYSLTAQADRLHRVLDELDVEAPIVVAHSIGSSMALRLACRHPDRVRAVVSLEGGPAEEVATPGFRRAMKLRPLLRLLGTGGIRSRIRGMLVARSGNPSWVTDDVVASYAAGPHAGSESDARSLCPDGEGPGAGGACFATGGGALPGPPRPGCRAAHRRPLGSRGRAPPEGASPRSASSASPGPGTSSSRKTPTPS